MTRQGATELPCVKSLTITVEGADIAETAPVWELSTAQPGRCASAFIYGQVPVGYAQARAAPTLSNGKRCLVEVSGPGFLGGAAFTVQTRDGVLTDKPAD